MYCLPYTVQPRENCLVISLKSDFYFGNFSLSNSFHCMLSHPFLIDSLKHIHQNLFFAGCTVFSRINTQVNHLFFIRNPDTAVKRDTQFKCGQAFMGHISKHIVSIQVSTGSSIMTTRRSVQYHFNCMGVYSRSIWFCLSYKSE